jgi:uncharacterized ferritin-like protein (DUF455 family)
MQTLGDAAKDILETADFYTKAEKTFSYYNAWHDNGLIALPSDNLPDFPSRLDKPEMLPPNKMPKRTRGEKGRLVLLHALTHIELNAIDLAWDILGRVWTYIMPKEFYSDWLQIAYEEASHFKMLANRLKDFNLQYGDFVAHNSLWEAAYKTKDDLAGRLAVVPMVLEARGLDVTPSMIKDFANHKDTETSKILETIYNDEIGHVATGLKWFRYIADIEQQDETVFFHIQLKKYYKGSPKPPFNDEARLKAGMKEEFYKYVN